MTSRDASAVTPARCTGELRDSTSRQRAIRAAGTLRALLAAGSSTASARDGPRERRRRRSLEPRTASTIDERHRRWSSDARDRLGSRAWRVRLPTAPRHGSTFGRRRPPQQAQQVDRDPRQSLDAPVSRARAEMVATRRQRCADHVPLVCTPPAAGDALLRRRVLGRVEALAADEPCLLLDSRSGAHVRAVPRGSAGSPRRRRTGSRTG